MEHYTNSCDACGTVHDMKRIDLKSGEKLYEPTEFGWFLPYKNFGYYMGFDDDIDVILGGEPYTDWWLCHDCVVKFFTTFPLLAEKFGKAHHPSDTDTPCCAFAWDSVDGVTMVPADDLQSWVPYLR